MTPADQLSFERQVAGFLGSMADELPGGRYTPPRRMLSRARVHMTVNLAAAALVAGAIVLGLLLAGRALLTTDGAPPLAPLIGGAGAIGQTDGRGIGSASQAIGDGYFGQGGYGPVSSLFDPPGGLRRGPDGGAWGRPTASHAPTGRNTGRNTGRREGSSGGWQQGRSEAGGENDPWVPPPLGGSGGGTVIPPVGSGWGAGQLPGWTFGLHAAQPREPSAERSTRRRSTGRPGVRPAAHTRRARTSGSACPGR